LRESLAVIDQKSPVFGRKYTGIFAAHATKAAFRLEFQAEAPDQHDARKVRAP
jgi:hypothetical protein